MSAIIGILLGITIVALGRFAAMDRDRAYYPVALIVIGSYYVLFAIMADDRAAVWIELVFASLFATVAVVGFRSSLWIVVAGLALHGVFDFTRHLIVPGSGIPPWWPAFCGAIDIAIATGLLAILLRQGHASDRARGAR